MLEGTNWRTSDLETKIFKGKYFYMIKQTWRTFQYGNKDYSKYFVRSGQIEFLKLNL